MNKKILIILMLLIFITNLKAMDMSYANHGVSTEVHVEDSSASLTIDLGLNTNLLQGLQDAVVGKIDSFFNPYIEQLKDIRKENIKRLNFKNSPASGMTNKIMNLIGMKDGIFTKLKVCDMKNESSYCDYFGKTQYFEASSLNPFAGIREQIKEQHDKLVEQVKEMGTNFKNQFNKAWDKALSNIKIDGPINDFLEDVFTFDILTDTLMDTIESNSFFKKESAESNAIKALLTNNTKTPTQIAIDYAKQTSPNLYNYDNVQLHYGKNINNNPISNNLCDLALNMFNANGDIQDKINEKLSKIRKELYKYATYLLIKKLTDEIGILALKQVLSKVTQCAVEATIASTNALTEMFGMPSWASSLTTTAVSSTTATAGTSSSKPSTADSSERSTSSEKAQNCLQEMADKNKTDTDIEAEVGLANHGTPNPLTLGQLWDFAPFSNLAIGVKLKGNWITNIPKTISDYAKCLSEGKTSVWMQSFHSCLEGNSAIEFKIKSDLNASIARLFNTVRKNKKNNCKIFEEASKTNLFSFDKIKLSFNQTIVMGEFVDDGTFNYFGSYVAKLAQAKIETPSYISPDIAFYKKELDEIQHNKEFETKQADGTIVPTRKFKTIQDFMDCGGVDTVEGGAYSCSTPSTVGFRNFCSEQVSDLVTNHYFQDIIQNSTKDSNKDYPEFSDIVKLRLSNINNCAKMLADLAEHPLIQKTKTQYVEPEDSITGSLDYIIDKKWLLETNQITQKEFNKSISILKSVQERFSSLTDAEKINICIKSKKRENILNTSLIYKLCKAYKIKLFNQIFIKAKTQFKSMPYSSKSSFANEMKKLKIESEKLTDTYNID